MSEALPAALDYISLIDKSPPRPAPTAAYSWREYNPDVKLLYLRDHKTANFELAKLGSGPLALGFDLEWKPTYLKGARENPVALVQLANHNTIFLLQITAMKEFPFKLAEILADPLIVKAGVGIQFDANKICKDWRITMHNCVDLSLLARTVDNVRWKGKYNTSLGLARLVESYEYRLMDKGKITRSNWEANLSKNQQEYASNDAHAGYVLYRKLESMIPSLPFSPDSTWYSFNMISGQSLTPDGLHWHAENPNYDPGPPPPPRSPKQVTDCGSRSQGQEATGSSQNRKAMEVEVGRRPPLSCQLIDRPAIFSRKRSVPDSTTRTESTASAASQSWNSKRHNRRRYNNFDNHNNYGQFIQPSRARDPAADRTTSTRTPATSIPAPGGNAVVLNTPTPKLERPQRLS